MLVLRIGEIGGFMMRYLQLERHVQSISGMSRHRSSITRCFMMNNQRLVAIDRDRHAGCGIEASYVPLSVCEAAVQH